MGNKDEPFYKLKKWEKIVDLQLYLLGVIVVLLIMTIIYDNSEESLQMWKDILINLGCSIGSTIVLTVVIYFKFLKHIPDETKKAIDTLLNDRLGYETTNHNALSQALNPDNAHLSIEHTEIKNEIKEKSNTLGLVVSKTGESVNALNHMIEREQYEKELKYTNLHVNEREIVDSIEKISNLAERMQNLNEKNLSLSDQVRSLQVELQEKSIAYHNLAEKYKELERMNHQVVREPSQTPNRSYNKNRGYDIDR